MSPALNIVLPVVLVAAGMVIAAVLLDRSRADRVAEGVSVAGVGVGGHTAAEAATIVRERVAQPARRSVVVERGEETYELSADEAELEVDVEATVDDAVARGRQGSLLQRVSRLLRGEPVEADVEPRVRFSSDAVDEFVEWVGEEVDASPRDADMDPAGATLRLTSSKEGFRMNEDELRGRVMTALGRPRGERRIEAPCETLAPQVTPDDLAERHPRYLTIDRDNFRLHYYENLVKTTSYDISVGEVGHRTPAGEYDISDKAVDPTWYVPDQEWAGEARGEVIPPGPENPIKSRWLGLKDGIGIHGTDEEGSIGRRASRGCIRMLIPDVEELYEQVPVGTGVYID